jgi:HSP20 family molecular chaperone IbpA
MSLQTLGNPISLLAEEDPFALDPARWNRQFFSLVNPTLASSRLITSPLDLVEFTGHFLITLDLPGLQKDQVNMRIQDDLLIISGTRESSKETDELTTHISERVFGFFERRIRLPESADQSNVVAIMENGVLVVTVAKVKGMEEVMGQVIPIR